VRRLLNKAIPEWKLDYALKLYQHKEISLGKAAELSSLSIWEMLEITHNIIKNLSSVLMSVLENACYLLLNLMYILNKINIRLIICL